MSYPKDALPAPAAALEDDRSFELARLWYAAGAPHVVARPGVWPDPAAWGFVLGEMARDIAMLYSDGDHADHEGAPAAAAALARIRAAFDEELDGGTSGGTSGASDGIHAG